MRSVGLLDKLAVQVVRLAPGLLVGVLLALGDELDNAGRIGKVVLALEQAKYARAAHEDRDAPVVLALEHALDLTGAADRLELVVCEPHDPELALAVEALLDHRAVALLEDVQRHALGRQRDDPQRKQWKILDGRFGHLSQSMHARAADWRTAEVTQRGRPRAH